MSANATKTIKKYMLKAKPDAPPKELWWDPKNDHAAIIVGNFHGHVNIAKYLETKKVEYSDIDGDVLKQQRKVIMENGLKDVLSPADMLVFETNKQAKYRNLVYVYKKGGGWIDLDTAIDGLGIAKGTAKRTAKSSDTEGSSHGDADTEVEGSAHGDAEEDDAEGDAEEGNGHVAEGNAAHGDAEGDAEGDGDQGYHIQYKNGFQPDDSVKEDGESALNAAKLYTGYRNLQRPPTKFRMADGNEYAVVVAGREFFYLRWKEFCDVRKTEKWRSSKLDPKLSFVDKFLVPTTVDTMLTEAYSKIIPEDTLNVITKDLKQLEKSPLEMMFTFLGTSWISLGTAINDMMNFWHKPEGKEIKEIANMRKIMADDPPKPPRKRKVLLPSQDVDVDEADILAGNAEHETEAEPETTAVAEPKAKKTRGKKAKEAIVWDFELPKGHKCNIVACKHHNCGWAPYIPKASCIDSFVKALTS